jgi:PncC family amidohydrolase
VNPSVDRVAEALAGEGLHLVVAESCTGGMLAAALTDRPGASRFLDAGLVTYSNEAKERMLGVRPEILASYGAVSRQVAEAMAAGARATLGADLGLSITGIAGPDGGSADKPVGTVWMALASAEGVEARRFLFEGERGTVRSNSVKAAIDMLDRYLERRG